MQLPSPTGMVTAYPAHVTAFIVILKYSPQKLFVKYNRFMAILYSDAQSNPPIA